MQSEDRSISDWHSTVLSFTITALLKLYKTEHQQADTKKVSKKNSAMQRREERMMKFYIFIKTKLRLEQALFEQKI